MFSKFPPISGPDPTGYQFTDPVINERALDVREEKKASTDSRRGAQKAGGGTEADCAAKSAAAMTSEARGDRYHDCSLTSFLFRIYVSNIPFSFRSPDLIAMFSPFGQVSNAEIVMNERGSKGFGFVTLDSKEASEAARAALNGTVVNGRVIEVFTFIYLFRDASKTRVSKQQL
ncbi:unnamed protein product [Heligmosomoides polygyrus]|uniref:RRM domain-containing protein n=1 Tax=Heligmosomoides polygyrus TaxID=6339 RepID=A0A183G6E0_HELPZ|nr:unnamed protein product [Heligmosomoides polygyrus]